MNTHIAATGGGTRLLIAIGRIGGAVIALALAALVGAALAGSAHAGWGWGPGGEGFGHQADRRHDGPGRGQGTGRTDGRPYRHRDRRHRGAEDRS